MQVPDRKASFIGSNGDSGSPNPAGGTGTRAKLRAAVRAAEEKRKQQELVRVPSPSHTVRALGLTAYLSSG